MGAAASGCAQAPLRRMPFSLPSRVAGSYQVSARPGCPGRERGWGQFTRDHASENLLPWVPEVGSDRRGAAGAGRDGGEGGALSETVLRGGAISPCPLEGKKLCQSCLEKYLPFAVQVMKLQDFPRTAVRAWWCGSGLPGQGSSRRVLSLQDSCLWNESQGRLLRGKELSICSSQDPSICFRASHELFICSLFPQNPISV